MSRKKLPDLRPEMTDIELDQISLLVEKIQKAFVDAFGWDGDLNLWDAVRIKQEMEDLFTPKEFNRLMQTEFGRGIAVGAWIQAFVLNMGDEDAFEEG